MKKIKPTIQKLIDPEVLQAALGVVKLVPHLPEFMGRAILDEYTKGMDISLSNLSFSDKTWSFNGKEIKNIRFFNNIGLFLCGGIIAFTYNNKLRLSMMAKRGLKMDSKFYFDSLVKNLEEEIDKLDK